jgi:hypothetical protein
VRHEADTLYLLTAQARAASRRRAHLFVSPLRIATLLLHRILVKVGDSITMLISLQLLSLASFGYSLIVNPRQNFNNASSPTPTVVTSTGLEWASECIESKYSWASDNGTKFASTTVYITSNTYADIYNDVDYKTATSLKKNATAYTLCDKWPRLDGSTSISTHSYQRITNWTSSFIMTESVSTAYPAPNCTILLQALGMLPRARMTAILQARDQRELHRQEAIPGQTTHRPFAAPQRRSLAPALSGHLDVLWTRPLYNFCIGQSQGRVQICVTAMHL